MALQRENHQHVSAERAAIIHKAVKIAGELGYKRIMEELKQKKLNKILEENKDVWKTESTFYSWIRGGIRSGLWNKHPIKLKVLNKSKKDIANPNLGKPRNYKPTIKGGTCSVCEQDFPMKNLEVDHVHGGTYSLKSIEDVQGFFEQIVLVAEEDLRIVCKYCHSVLSYASKEGLTEDEARVKKLVIEILKQNKHNELLEIFAMPRMTKTKAKDSLIEPLKYYGCPNKIQTVDDYIDYINAIMVR